MSFANKNSADNASVIHAHNWEITALKELLSRQEDILNRLSSKDDKLRNIDKGVTEIKKSRRSSSGQGRIETERPLNFRNDEIIAPLNKMFETGRLTQWNYKIPKQKLFMMNLSSSS